jgi:hypothetical protein
MPCRFQNPIKRENYLRTRVHENENGGRAGLPPDFSQDL